MHLQEEDLELFKSVFPLEVEVSDKIILHSNTEDINFCIGANSLIKGLGKAGLDRDIPYLFDLNNPDRISWGVTSSDIKLINYNPLKTSSIGEKSKLTSNYITIISYDVEGVEVDMMEIKKPMKIIFKLVTD